MYEFVEIEYDNNDNIRFICTQHTVCLFQWLLDCLMTTTLISAVWNLGSSALKTRGQRVLNVSLWDTMAMPDDQFFSGDGSEGQTIIIFGLFPDFLECRFYPLPRFFLRFIPASFSPKIIPFSNPLRDDDIWKEILDGG